MAACKTLIPWTSEKDWTQAVFSIRNNISVLSAKSAGNPDIAAIWSLAEQINKVYTVIDRSLEGICHTTCPQCVNVCCVRATVWYDMKDLVFIYLNTGSFPEKQITRQPDKTCCNLTLSGCRLKRSARPFICTWYICPEQNNALQQLPDSNAGSTVLHAILQIKTARRELDQMYNAVLSR